MEKFAYNLILLYLVCIFNFRLKHWIMKWEKLCNKKEDFFILTDSIIGNVEFFKSNFSQKYN